MLPQTGEVCERRFAAVGLLPRRDTERVVLGRFCLERIEEAHELESGHVEEATPALRVGEPVPVAEEAQTPSPNRRRH